MTSRPPIPPEIALVIEVIDERARSFERSAEWAQTLVGVLTKVGEEVAAASRRGIADLCESQARELQDLAGAIRRCYS